MKNEDYSTLIIASKYKLINKIGEGAFGEVFLGKNDKRLILIQINNLQLNLYVL